MPQLVPEEQRRFAVEVVRALRAAGFEAYWAGGCVRDQVRGRTPKDYDVATSATPPQIRSLFGRRRTLAIGAAFGCISVVGPKPAGTVEVTTFREDAAYSDGRHPDGVTFSSAREDAQRRDFTINGLFFDPLTEQVIDFVGGQADLERGLMRAIGRPADRFGEDKLRMLRAVRFAATFGFAIEAETRAAIEQMAAEIVVVSPERIAMEMRRMLVDTNRAEAVRLLVDVGLAAVVLPEIVPTPGDAAAAATLDRALTTLTRLPAAEFPLALAALLREAVTPAGVLEIGRRWRLANKEVERAVWLVEHRDALLRARAVPWSELQPILIDAAADDLLALTAAAVPQAGEELAFCQAMRALPHVELDPPPLISGDDLRVYGLPAGPAVGQLLRQLRAAQLDGQVQGTVAALALVDRLCGGDENSDMDKKAKKKIDVLHQRIQGLQQKLAGAKKQADDPDELKSLEQQIAAAEAELARLKAEAS